MAHRFIRRILSTGFAIGTLASASLLSSTSAMATIVEFQTSHGNFQVNLYDESTPITVANFLSYVDEGNGRYNNTVIHRVVSNFIVQGGGFKFNGNDLERISTDSAIKNEPVFSNVKGTIAMAKTSDPDSATSQWFFNTVNNSNGLDIKSNSGGFTVFGEVVNNESNTMEYNEFVDSIEKSTICGSIPNVNVNSCNDTESAENFVTIYQIVIVDSSAVTAANLNPPKNTLVNKSDGGSSSSGGGGSMFWVTLLSLTILPFSRKSKK